MQTDARRFTLAHALLAPNPHNRQPWIADLREPGRLHLVCDGEPQGWTLPEGAFAAGFDHETWPLAPLIKGPGPTAPVRFRLRTDAMLARQAAVETGLGVAPYLADVAATRPGLRRILADRFGQVQEVWLCAHDELRRSASMRFVWDRLEQALRARLQG